MTTELLGWLGGLLFAICAIPQAWQSYKQGHSKGLNSGLLQMWFWGEVLTVSYVYLKHGFDGPLMLNYLANIVFLVVIMKYKYKPRQEQKDVVE